jgi:hypothetical protein
VIRHCSPRRLELDQGSFRGSRGAGGEILGAGLRARWLTARAFRRVPVPAALIVLAGTWGLLLAKPALAKVPPGFAEKVITPVESPTAHPYRFEKSRTVGAYLGLVFATDRSGEREPQKRISKEGDETLRRLLGSSAHRLGGRNLALDFCEVRFEGGSTPV